MRDLLCEALIRSRCNR